MAKIAKCLSRFDHSGHCASITASCTTILRTLRALEDRYSGKDRQKWSRPTLFRYLKLLEKQGVARRGDGKRWSSGCWTRRRSLHSSFLLPRESETVGNSNLRLKKSLLYSSKKNTHRLESEKAPVTLDRKSFELQKAKTSAVQQEQTPLTRSCQVKDLMRAPRLLPLLNAITEKFGSDWAFDGLNWAARPIPEDEHGDRVIHNPLAYVLACIRNLIGRWYDGTFTENQVATMLERVLGVDTGECWQAVELYALKDGDRVLWERWRYKV
ncbi:MAG: hypothetical protein WBL66_10775 [Candidatus Acidiferrales bacterium]